MLAIGGLLGSAKVSVRGQGESQGQFGGFVSGPEIYVSRKPEIRFAETWFEIAP
jgi:hypothetical protein